MNKQTPLPWKLYNGLTGNHGMSIMSVRTDPATGKHISRHELIESPTEVGALTTCQLRVEELEKDETVVRIVVSVVASERRREAAKEVFGRIVLPFRRVNGNH